MLYMFEFDSIFPSGDTDIADWRTAIRGARCVSSYTRRSKRMKKGPIVPPGWNNNLIVDAILFLPTGAVVDIWSHWLPSCLVPSSVPDGRHNLMVTPLYSRTPRRSLRVALAIKILFLPPWPLALPPRQRARFFLDLFVLDPSFLSPCHSLPLFLSLLASLRHLSVPDAIRAGN